MLNIVENIICNEFEKNVGRWQSKNEKKIAMIVTFNLSIDGDIEDGYRFLDMVIYEDCNYVAVIVKERWDIIPKCDLEYEDDECFIKENSNGYRKGDTGWKLVSYHDSCWRSDGVHRILWINREKIINIDQLFNGWYQKIEINKEILSVLNNENGYELNKGVLHFNHEGKEIS
jgi:hypothetical protein